MDSGSKQAIPMSESVTGMWNSLNNEKIKKLVEMVIKA